MSSEIARNTTVADLRFVHQGANPPTDMRYTLPSGSVSRATSMPTGPETRRVSEPARPLSIEPASRFSTPLTGPLAVAEFQTAISGFHTREPRASGSQQFQYAASTGADLRSTTRPSNVTSQEERSLKWEEPATREDNAPNYELYRMYSGATLHTMNSPSVDNDPAEGYLPLRQPTEQWEFPPIPDGSRHMPSPFVSDQMGFADSNAMQSASYHSYRLQSAAVVAPHVTHSITDEANGEPPPRQMTSQIMRDPQDLAAYPPTAKSLLMTAEAGHFNYPQYGDRPQRRTSAQRPERVSSTFFVPDVPDLMADPFQSENLEEDVNLRVFNLVGLPIPPSSVLNLGTSYRVCVVSAEGKQLGATSWVEADGDTANFPANWQVIRMKTRAASLRAFVETQGQWSNERIGWVNLHRLDPRSGTRTCYTMESEDGTELDSGGLTCIFEENPVVNNGLGSRTTIQARAADEHGVVCVLEIDKVTHLPAPSMLQQSNVTIRVLDQDGQLLTTLGPFPVKPQPENASKRYVSVQQRVGVKGPLHYDAVDEPRGTVGHREGTMLLRLEVGYLANIGQAGNIGTCEIASSWITREPRTLPFGNGCNVHVVHQLMHEKQWMVQRSQPPATSSLPPPAGDLQAESPVKPVMPAPSLWDTAMHRVKGKSVQEELNESMINNEYVATRVRDKVRESLEPVATFRKRMASGRHWQTLDALFKSMGPSPTSNSEVYGPQLCRGASSIPPLADNDANKVTLGTVDIGQHVQRRPKDWKWGDDDGGAGNIGTIFHIDRIQQICGVEWDNGIAHNHYRIGKNSKHDLAQVNADADHTAIPWVAQSGAQLRDIFKHGKPEPHYLPMSKLRPDSIDAVKYSSYRKERDAKLSFADAVTGYRSKEDIWAASSGDRSRNKSGLPVPGIRCVKDDCIMA
eukprot:GEMP01009056.1.p1 GENE.GEMP01009056.1~~GEMP01009056.1.p1  ORF type:complete len:914 (+),score=190.28 GEMP01009056.1:332-3073(+)